MRRGLELGRDFLTDTNELAPSRGTPQHLAGGEADLPGDAPIRFPNCYPFGGHACPQQPLAPCEHIWVRITAGPLSSMTPSLRRELTTSSRLLAACSCPVQSHPEPLLLPERHLSGQALPTCPSTTHLLKLHTLGLGAIKDAAPSWQGVGGYFTQHNPDCASPAPATGPHGNAEQGPGRKTGQGVTWLNLGGEG